MSKNFQKTTICVITVLLVLAVLVLASCERTDITAANISAGEFAKHVDGSTGVTCAEVDTDGDGYVSCTVFRGHDEPMQIQCGSQRLCVWNCARGCKYQSSEKLNIRRAR